MPDAGPWYEEFVHLPLVSRTASISPGAFRTGPCRGVLFVVYVKTAGTSTLAFRTSAREIPEFAGWVPSVNVDVSNPGVYMIPMYPGATMQPPGEAADTTDTAVVQVIGLPPPDQLRCSFVKGDSSAWVFGCSVRRLR